MAVAIGKLAENLRETLPFDVFTDTEVFSLLQKTENARHSLLKRASQSGDIIRLRRGVYALGRRYQRQSLNLFEVAGKLYPISYISLESALSFHGMIPEAVYTVTSVAAKRSAEFATSLALFSFQHLPTFNLLGVERLVQGSSIFMMATPTKALVDFILIHKMQLKSLRDLSINLRLEEGWLENLEKDLLQNLAATYRSKRLAKFMQLIKKEGGV